jgi:hypothetical protein
MGSEKNLKVAAVGQEMQVLAENVATLATPKIIQEQVQVGGDIGKTFVANTDRIEAYLEKTILMIKRQENLVPLQCWKKKIQMRMLNFMPKLI